MWGLCRGVREVVAVGALNLWCLELNEVGDFGDRGNFREGKEVFFFFLSFFCFTSWLEGRDKLDCLLKTNLLATF